MRGPTRLAGCAAGRDPPAGAGAAVAAATGLDRVRLCAGEPCGWLFLDDSKSGNRRWCSMEYCGNRAKARAHYRRHAAHRAHEGKSG